ISLRAVEVKKTARFPATAPPSSHGATGPPGPNPAEGGDLETAIACLQCASAHASRGRDSYVPQGHRQRSLNSQTVSHTKGRSRRNRNRQSTVAHTIRHTRRHDTRTSWFRTYQAVDSRPCEPNLNWQLVLHVPDRTAPAYRDKGQDPHHEPTVSWT